MVAITGKVRHPSWKKRKRSKRKITVYAPMTPKKKMETHKSNYEKKAAWLGMTVAELIERDKQQEKVKEAKRARREANTIRKNHLDTSSDTLAEFSETLNNTRPLHEQIKALEKKKLSINMRIERLLMSPDGRRKSEFGAMRIDKSKPFPQAIVSSLEGALNADDKKRLGKYRASLQGVEYKIWLLEQKLPVSYGGEGNAQFNRNSVKRERHYIADKGKQITKPIGNRDKLDKTKPASNNWRKEMNARQIAKILYEDELKPDNQNAFNLALKAYDRLSDQEQERVAFYQQQIAKRKAGVQ